MKSFKQYITEATLSGNSTNGTPNVKKYVIDNPKALKITFEIEKSKKDVPVYDGSGDIITTLRAGDKFKLKSKKILDIKGKPAVDTTLGIIPANFVRKPSGFKAMDAEILATNGLDEAINKMVNDNDGKGINIKIGKFVVKDVTKAGSDHIKGDPKADIALINSKGKEVGFISHKKEGGANGFSQFGGITLKSGLKHKEIDSFVNALINEVGKGKAKAKATSGDAFYRFLKDKNLICASVYGPEYGSGFSRENCHCIGQGNPILSRKGKIHELDFSESMHINGDYKFATIGKFKAVFGATFRSGRKVTSKKGEVINIRAGIYPVAFMESRRNLKEI